MVIRSFGNNEALKLDDVLQLAIVAVVLYNTMHNSTINAPKIVVVSIDWCACTAANNKATKINGLKFFQIELRP